MLGFNAHIPMIELLAFAKNIKIKKNYFQPINPTFLHWNNNYTEISFYNAFVYLPISERALSKKVTTISASFFL